MTGFRAKPMVAFLLCLAVSWCFGETGEHVLVSPGSGSVAINAWRIDASEGFRGWVDRRGLVVLDHSFSPSVAGADATARCSFTLPAEFLGPLRLHFYMSDTYDGRGERLEKDWLGEADFRGQLTLRDHRYKQVFIDGSLVWEEDVADAAGPGSEKRYSVALPNGLQPGIPHELIVRMWDKVASNDHNATDKRHIGDQEHHAIHDEDEWAFPTTLYAGDMIITPDAIHDVAPRNAPIRELVKQRHEARWPLAPISSSLSFPVQLEVQGARANGQERPVHCGVPLPLGAVTSGVSLELSADGNSLPLQTSPMNFWPDGSVRWMEIDAILPPETSSVALSVGTTPSNAPADLVTTGTTADGKLELKTGNLTVLCTAAGLLEIELRSGSTSIDGLHGDLRVSDRQYDLLVKATKVLANGPIRGQVALSGTLESDGNSLGRFEVQVAVFAGQPYVQTTWRIFNDTPTTLDVSGWELVARTSLPSPVDATWDAEKVTTGESVWIRQHENGFSVTNSEKAIGTGQYSPGWLSVSQGESMLLVAVRHFAEQFPSALGFEDGIVHIGLFSNTPEILHYQPHEGEAKRHEVWFGVWDKAVGPHVAIDSAANAGEPARLFNADYYCATGAMGEAYPHDESAFAELTAIMDERHHGSGTVSSVERAEAMGDYGIRRGIRHWGDSPYGTTHWCNGYYDRQQGFAVEYLMTGDYDWFQRLEATVRHIIDIDICHQSREHPEWVGSIHGLYAEDHSTGGAGSAPWPPGQRTKGTLAYWRYTADTAARDAALGVADSAIACGRGLGATSVRDHAGILYCVMAAYDETGDAKYLEAARALAHDSLRCIDPRRGAYEELHGNVNFYGGLPWLQAQLAEPLYDYYRASGDVDAAAAVVGIAESIMTENARNCDPETMYGYSFSPVLRSAAEGKQGAMSGYDVLVAPVLFYAFDLTGDESFLNFGRGLYARTIRENTVNSVANCYWNTDTMLYFLHEFRATPQLARK